MEIKLTLIMIFETSNGAYFNRNHEIHGPDAPERAASVIGTAIQSWVVRDKLKLVSITLTAHQ